VLEGLTDERYVQSVRELNRQCFIVPDHYEQEGDGFIAPLFQRVRTALANASRYVAPQTLTWHRRNTCLGCHVQNQAITGLQGAMGRA
jgi:hypothetical protein